MDGTPRAAAKKKFTRPIKKGGNGTETQRDGPSEDPSPRPPSLPPRAHRARNREDSPCRLTLPPSEEEPAVSKWEPIRQGVLQRDADRAARIAAARAKMASSNVGATPPNL